MIPMVADDPQALVVHEKNEFAAVIIGYTDDFIEDFDGFRMPRIRQID
jgi:hypothetical protein